MATYGKSINLFLMDGTASDRIKCTLANWTGVAYKIPRTKLDLCKERNDLRQSGVYFLFGTDEETDKSVVYIGQAGVRKNGEGVLYRLQEHKRNADKDYWTEAIVFTTSNNSFGPTEISYLENRFCAIASEAERYKVKNVSDPTSGNITEEKESELEEFISNARIIMGTLGHKVFEKLTENITIKSDTQESTRSNGTIFHFERKGGKASGTPTSEGFVVLAGSYINPTVADYVHVGVKNLRKQYATAIDEKGVLHEDVLCKSPAMASNFVAGKNSNAQIEWKTADGKTLRDIESSGMTEI